MQSFNLNTAAILLVCGDEPRRAKLCGMLSELGANAVRACATSAEALDHLAGEAIRVFIVEADAEGEGLSFVRKLRREGGASATAPVIISARSMRAREVALTRDCGASAVLLDPISPAAMRARIVTVVRDVRPFIDTASYVGPDRRWRFEGPPVGLGERRAMAPLGEGGADLSQLELDALFAPRKAML